MALLQQFIFLSQAKTWMKNDEWVKEWMEREHNERCEQWTMSEWVKKKKKKYPQTSHNMGLYIYLQIKNHMAFQNKLM